MVKIGIIGGSGLDNPDILKEVKEIEIPTPYGSPSSRLKIGKINDIDVVLLARHGPYHTIPPTQVNFRANIYALKQLGCTHILATTAVGSLREEIQRGDLVIPDQFIDFTRHRHITFHEHFEPHSPKHTPMPEPFCKNLRNLLIKTCEELNLKHHKKGTVITIEGPRFSTKAESKMFKSWGADIINMSIAPEAILANELGIPYSAIAMSTDYDCIFDDMPSVTWDEILKVFNQNVAKVTNLIINTIPKISETHNHAHLKSKIRTVQHWPKPGVMFRDITTLLKCKEGFNQMIDALAERYKHSKPDIIAGIESRGFIIGSALAHRLGIGFAMIRKPNKLPAEKEFVDYKTEYSTDRIEIHKDAIQPKQKVLLVDDLIATGGSLLAACNLIEKLGGIVQECAVVINLPELGGKRKIENAGYKVFNLIEFGGE